MKSESISELAKALSGFQGKMTAVKKDATNPFYKSKYATLDTIWETIRKPLSDNGLSVAQTMGIIPDSKSVLETTLYHTSGEWISGTQLVNPVKDDPQSLGSAISYARRYSLSAILGIVADEDDDANVATKPAAKTQEKPVLPNVKTTQKDEACIPAPQTKKIYALVKEKGLTAAQMRDYIKKTFNKASSKELTTSEENRLIDDIESDKIGGGHLVNAALKQGAEIIKED